MKLVLRIIIRTAVATLLTVAQNRGHAATSSDPSGSFLTEDGRARVRIEHCGPAQDRICGYIVWMNEGTDANGQPLRDRLNPDPAKRTRPLLGHQFILGLKPTAEGRFAGEIYNAEDGRTYGVSIWRDTPDRLKVKGCLLGARAGRGRTTHCLDSWWDRPGTSQVPRQIRNGLPPSCRRRPKCAGASLAHHARTGRSSMP